MTLNELKNIIDSIDLDVYGNDDVSVITLSKQGLQPNDILAGIACDISVRSGSEEVEKLLQDNVGPDDFVIIVPDTIHVDM